MHIISFSNKIVGKKKRKKRNKRHFHNIKKLIRNNRRTIFKISWGNCQWIAPHKIIVYTYTRDNIYIISTSTYVLYTMLLLNASSMCTFPYPSLTLGPKMLDPTSEIPITKLTFIFFLFFNLPRMLVLLFFVILWARAVLTVMDFRLVLLHDETYLVVRTPPTHPAQPNSSIGPGHRPGPTIKKVV